MNDTNDTIKKGIRVLINKTGRTGTVVDVSHRNGYIYSICVSLDAKSVFSPKTEKWIYEADVSIIGFP